MAQISGGHLVARYLKEVEGVSTVFSLSGGHIDRIYDGFLRYGVKVVDARHEQAAAMMAHAYTIYTGRPGVCLVTAGPGFTNALTGLVNASLENVPLVVLSGTAPVRDWEKGALQEMKQAEMARGVVKWHGMCHDTRRIAEYLSTAFRFAVNGRPGPVLLEMPPDVLNVSVDEATVGPATRGSVVFRSQPDPRAAKRAAQAVAEAKKPLILGGSGVAFSGCGEVLQKFVEKTGIPFVLMNAGRGVLPDTHPLCLWDGTQTTLMTALMSADCILALGIRFNWLLLYGQGFPQAKVVRVDIEPSEINRNRPADIGLCGDLSLALDQLLGLVQPKDCPAWIQELKLLSQAGAEGEKASRYAPSAPIHPARLVELVRQAAGDGAIYIMDGGDTSYFGVMGLTATEKASVLGAAGGLLGCLGTGVPFGVGAKLARPDKRVVVVSGDGSFGFNAMEFDTALRHNAPFVCVIVNDQAWGMIKHGQEICYGPDRCIGSELGVIHYEKVAEALGGFGVFVEKEQDVIPAMKAALDSGKPACVNVLTDKSITSPATLLFSQSLKMD